MIAAGACAVQVGTASFADPRAVQRVTAGLRRWMRRAGVSSVDALRGVAHDQEQ
jgi:dihydroorotate dehydrogenase (NAD+) catalytic subunit